MKIQWEDVCLSLTAGGASVFNTPLSYAWQSVQSPGQVGRQLRAQLYLQLYNPHPELRIKKKIEALKPGEAKKVIHILFHEEPSCTQPANDLDEGSTWFES